MLSEQTNSITDRLKGMSSEKAIESLASWATANNLPFVVYRLPDRENFHFLIGSTIKSIENDDLSSLETGYLVSSYNGNKYYIDKALFYNSASGEIEIFSKTTQNLDLDEFGITDSKWKPYSTENECDSTSYDEFLKYIANCIKEINQTDLIKVVPSRLKKIKLVDLDLCTLFTKLCKAYESAYISLLSTPNLGTWIGATPESLIELDENGIFETMSLAGTQEYNGELPLHALPWTQKEIEEQAMVSRYIINRFKEIRLREFVEVGPRTVQAGNLAHLCSTYTVDTVLTNFPDLGSTMLKLLHPTSAVCGMPKNLAQELIKSKEKHDRKLYAGYFGPINMEEGSHIYVNLRCMQVVNDTAMLYAGVGVTGYSVAEHEWGETEAKYNTLLNIIQE